MLEKNTSADPVYYCDVSAYVAEHKEVRRMRKLEHITQVMKKRQHIQRVLKYFLEEALSLYHVEETTESWMSEWPC